MPAAPLHPQEKDRLDILNRYAILDTLPEEHYDELTFLASQICGTPIALVSLVDRDRQWFKSRLGLDAAETPRELSFCAHAILQKDVFTVKDAREDERFATNEFVTGSAGIRFYAGAPLISPDGYPLGTICVVDRIPRELTENQTRSLRALAHQVVNQMELWRTVKRLQIADAGRQQALAQLAANATLLRQFVEHAPASIAMLDREMRFIAVSRRFRTEFDVEGEELSGRSHYDVFPHMPAEWKAIHARCLAGAVETCEMDEFERRDGRKDFYRWEVRPWRRANGEIGGIMMLVEIITAKVRAERIKNEFLSVVSHELRTPLTSIRGALGLLSGGVAGELPPAAQSMVEIARKNSERLVLLINDILDIEKIESGKMRFDWLPVAVPTLVESVMEANRGYAETYGVSLKWRGGVEACSEISVTGDETRLVQVLSNLISNACKFSPPGGTVTLQCLATAFDAENNAKTVELAPGEPLLGEPPFGEPPLQPLVAGLRFLVSDEGPGVPAEFVPRLFEKFAQADASTTRQASGTGLGLAIAAAIVEKHGGSIGYHRGDGPEGAPGAIFFVDLPRANANADLAL